MDGKTTNLWLAACISRRIDARESRIFLLIIHRDQRAATSKINYSYTIGDPDSIYSSTHGIACTVAYGSTEFAAKVHSCYDKHHRQQHLQWVHEQRNWTMKNWRKLHGPMIHIFWYIASTGSANMPISNEHPSYSMHSGSKISLWRLYNRVDNVFIDHIKSHNPHRHSLMPVCYYYLNVVANNVHPYKTIMFQAGYQRDKTSFYNGQIFT